MDGKFTTGRADYYLLLPTSQAGCGSGRDHGQSPPGRADKSAVMRINRKRTKRLGARSSPSEDRHAERREASLSRGRPSPSVMLSRSEESACPERFFAAAQHDQARKQALHTLPVEAGTGPHSRSYKYLHVLLRLMRIGADKSAVGTINRPLHRFGSIS